MMDRLEVKASLSIDEKGEISGLAWPFDGRPDRVGDVIEKGAVSVVTADTPMLFEHDARRLIGVWNEVRETDRGVEVKGQIDLSHISGRGVRGLIQTGQVSGLSIGFRAKEFTRKSQTSRVITALDLVEISIVKNPANPRARVIGVKSASDADRLIEALNRAIRTFS